MKCENCQALVHSNGELLDAQLTASAELAQLQARVRELGEALELGEGERRWDYLRAEFADLFEAPQG